MKSCFFIGHREASSGVFSSIIEAAEKLILEEQVSEFFAGGYGNFDRMAGEAIIQLKEKYPFILVLI